MIRHAACLFAVMFLGALARAEAINPENDLATHPAKVDLSHSGDLSRRIEVVLQKQTSALVPQLHPWDQDSAALLLYRGNSTEVDIRSNAHLVFGLAVLHRATGDKASSDKAIAILRFLLPTHGAGEMKCADGKQWHNQWQSAYWAYSTGKAAWILWDDLDPKLKWLAARMVCDEADRFVSKKPPTQVERDTKAEENAWDSTIVALAYNMFPAHPHHESWRETAIRWQISSYVTAADVKSEQVIDGKPLNQWLTGPNLHDDYTLENHDRVHPDYMGTTRINLYQELIYAWAGNPPPEAIRFNAEKIYANEKKLSLPDGSLVYPNGEDWQLHRNADWIDLNSIMAVRFNDPAAARLARLNLESAEKMLARGSKFGMHFPDETIVATTHAVNVELYADPYLLLRAAGEGPPPVEEAKLWKDVSGTHVFESGEFAVVRSEHSVATFSWGRQFMGMVMPLKKDLLLTPNDRGLIGIIKSDTKKRETPVVKRVETFRPLGGFAICGIAARGNDGSIEQRFAFVALPDGRTIYADDLPPMEQAMDRCPLGVLNEVNWVYHDGKRTLHFENGEKVFVAADADNTGDFTFSSPWYNLDDGLGMVCLHPLSQQIYHSKPSPIRARREQIFALNSSVTVFYPAQSSPQTRDVAARCKLEPLGTPRDLTIVLEDGKRVHLDLDNLKVSIP